MSVQETEREQAKVRVRDCWVPDAAVSELVCPCSGEETTTHAEGHSDKEGRESVPRTPRVEEEAQDAGEPRNSEQVSVRP